MNGPDDSALRTRWVRERRRAAAAHHPDRGGDTDTYLAALAAVDRAFGMQEPAGPLGGAVGVEVHVRRTWRGSRMRVARRTRRAVRTMRSRFPRSFPDA